jgi:Flp pilus assembly protein TadD
LKYPLFFLCFTCQKKTTMRMSNKIEESDSIRCRVSRLAPALGCAALLLLAACAGDQETVPEETVSDDQAVMEQNEKATKLMHIGNRMREKGDLNGAAEMYHRAGLADPSSPLPPAALADTLRHLGQYREAEEIYHQILATHPYSGLALQGYGILLIEQGQPDAAITLLVPAVDEDAADHRVFNVLGIAYDALGDHTEAQNQYLAGLSMAPGNRSLSNNMALSLALQERYAAGIAQVESLMTGTDADKPLMHNLALIYGLAGKISDAGAILRDLLPEPDVVNNLAYYQNLRSMDPEQRRAAILDIILKSIYLNFGNLTEDGA